MGEKVEYQKGHTEGCLTFIRRATVLEYRQQNLRKKSYGVFECICGNECIKPIDKVLVLRTTRHCGCSLGKQKTREDKKYGQTLYYQNRIEYSSWASMMQRCNNEKNPAYAHYRELGVTVCDEWNEFDRFLEDMGPRASKYNSIDRIDNLKGYFKANCRWATKKEQQRNRRNTAFATYKGITKPISEWAELIGIKLSPLYARIVDHKWDVERALTQPCKGQVLNKIIL